MPLAEHVTVDSTVEGETFRRTVVHLGTNKSGDHVVLDGDSSGRCYLWIVPVHEWQGVENFAMDRSPVSTIPYEMETIESVMNS